MKRVWIQRIFGAACLAASLSTTPAAGAPPVPTGGGPGEAYFTKGVDAVMRGDAVHGFRMMAASVALAPNDMMRSTYLQTFLDLPQYNWDVSLLEQTQVVAPHYPPLLLRLGRLYEGKQRFREAEALYVRWANLMPDAPEPHARLGELYYFTQRYDRALAAFSRHRRLVGESDYAVRRMIAIHQILGNGKEARQLRSRLSGNRPEPDTVATAATENTGFVR